jgi:ribose transport system permease protein
VSVPAEAERGRLVRPWALKAVGKAIGPKNIGAIYVLAVVIVVFGIWSPDVFLRTATATSILNQEAIGAIATLGLLVALAAGMFDLSFGFTLGVSNVTFAWMLLHTGLPIGVELLICTAIGAAIGAVNGLIIVLGSLDSFIVTLATGSVLEGLQLLVSNDQNIVPTQISAINRITGVAVGGLIWPVFYLLALALLLWYVLEFTPAGRRVFATGMGPEAARLVGVKTGVIRVVALAVSGACAGLGGALVTGLVGQGSPTIGPEYLLPAYAAAFLGATQLRQLRFNVWGTLIAIFLLATASQGLFLVGLPSWVSYVFNGVTLLAAVALSRTFGRPRKVRAASITTHVPDTPSTEGHEIDGAAVADVQTTP